MRIAVPVEGEKIALQFAGCSNFKFYYVENDTIVRSFTISSGVDTVEENAKFLRMAGAQMVICCGIGGAVIKALDREAILVMGGILGNADEKMKEFCDGTIRFSPIDPARVHNHGGCSHHHESGACSHEDCVEDCSSCAHAGEDGHCH